MARSVWPQLAWRSSELPTWMQPGRIDGPHPRRLDDVLLGDPADVGDLLRRAVLDALAQLVEAEGPVVDELLVPELLFDDDVHHAHGQGAVGARPGLDPERGARGVGAGARVDDDEVLAVVERVHEPVAHLGVGAADLELLGPHDLGLGELAAPAVVVAVQPAVAGHQAVEAEAGAVADVARGDGVAGAEGARHPHGVAVVAAAGALGDGDGVRPVVGDGVLHLVGDGVERLVPGDPLPLALALGPDLLHGVLDAVGVVDVLDAREALGAHRAAGEGVGVALDVDDDPVFHGDLHAAAAVAALARREYTTSLLAISVSFPDRPAPL